MLSLASCASTPDRPTPTSAAVVLGPDRGDGVLTLGIADVAPAAEAGARLAVTEVNEAGGVLGRPIEVVPPELADVVLGPDGLTVGSLVVALEVDAALLAQAAVEVALADGATTAAVVGDGADAVADLLGAVGVAVVEDLTVAEAVVLVGGRQAVGLVEVLDAGVDVRAVTTVSTTDDVDALTRAARGRPGALEGVHLLAPGGEAPESLVARLPDGVDPTGAAGAHDAVVLAALAAEGAGTDSPHGVAAVLPGMTSVGATCTGFADCRGLVADGTDIDLDALGAVERSGPDGRPVEATVTVRVLGADNRVDPNRTGFLVVAVDP